MNTKNQARAFIIDDPQLQKIVDSGKTTLRRFADVNLASRELCRALTDRPYMPNLEDDVLNDYIKPAREYMRSLAYELDADQRAALHNNLTIVLEAAHAMIGILDEVDK
ncbi:MAG: hypothetical protein ACJ72R_07550 [Nitrososphaeraceae archaeon]